MALQPSSLIGGLNKLPLYEMRVLVSSSKHMSTTETKQLAINEKKEQKIQEMQLKMREKLAIRDKQVEENYLILHNGMPRGWN